MFLLRFNVVCVGDCQQLKPLFMVWTNISWISPALVCHDVKLNPNINIVKWFNNNLQLNWRQESGEVIMSSQDSGCESEDVVFIITMPQLFMLLWRQNKKILKLFENLKIKMWSPEVLVKVNLFVIKTETIGLWWVVSSSVRSVWSMSCDHETVDLVTITWTHFMDNLHGSFTYLNVFIMTSFEV